MTATDRLRELLDELGVRHTDPAEWLTYWDDTNGHVWSASEMSTGLLSVSTAGMGSLTPEQAIDATLGPREQPPYGELIESLRRDWDIEASWDGLRRFWHVGWTEEHVRLCESVNIDQDWVRDLIERNSTELGGNGREFCNGAYQMMADEIFAFIHDNATLGVSDATGERQGVADLKAENAKLRELVRRLLTEYRYMRVRPRRVYLEHEGRMRAIEDELRNLGVEMDA